jgi:hypothetical protein
MGVALQCRPTESPETNALQGAWGHLAVLLSTPLEAAEVGRVEPNMRCALPEPDHSIGISSKRASMSMPCLRRTARATKYQMIAMAKTMIHQARD